MRGSVVPLTMLFVSGLVAAAGARSMLGAGASPGKRTRQEPVGERGADQRHLRQGSLPHPQVQEERLCSEVRV